MYSKNKDWFNYCSYWGTWNRTLLRMGGEYKQQIEISLTAVNPTTESAWDNHLECRIRSHVTPASGSDKITHCLPDFVYNQISERFGEEVADMFIHVDLFNLIDWEKFEQVDRDWTMGGGVPLMMVLKPGWLPPSAVLDYWVKNEKELTRNYRLHIASRLEKQKRLLEQKFNNQKNPGEFGKVVDYITTADNVWDPKKYIGSRKHFGVCFGKESQFVLQYLLGNAYIEGMIGDQVFRLFKNHSNFQLYLKDEQQMWPANVTFSVTVDRKAELIEYLGKKVS